MLKGLAGFRRTAVLAIAMAAAAFSACAAEINVASSGGFAPAYKALLPAFEKATGHTVNSVWGPSMGDTKNAIPKRLERGEPIDVVIMVGSSLDNLVDQGKVIPGTTVLLARSGIAMAVRKGAPKPDISTLEALTKTLLAAKSIAWSDSASGVYMEKRLIPRLGLSEALKDTARMIPAEPVGNVVARGEAEIGFQQLSELKHIEGIDIVGMLPDGAQETTLFSAGIVAGSKQLTAAKALLDYLASPGSAATINETGLQAAVPEQKTH
jgi:molybdate transport system substrate-binding protein